MEIKLEDIKATIIRLQGQMDVWNSLYQEQLKLETKSNETKKDSETVGA